MSILENILCTGINRGVSEYRSTPGAVLLDVRSPLEYQRKRVPESKNLPMEDLDQIGALVSDPTVPLFVYAYSPDTSVKAARRLRDLGYPNAQPIGGIKNCCGNQGYQGPTEGEGWDVCPLR